MKRSLLFLLGIAVAAFAGAYEIDEFEAKDAGSPDDYITAEFGGELKTIPADEVSSLQYGRLVVRQKFEDPFGEQPTSYQLYQGSAGDLSSMTALSADGADYDALVKAKFYERRGMSAEQDIEKAYFDGKNVYVPGKTKVIAFVNGSPIELKGDAPEETPVAAAPKKSSDDEEECDEYDTDCEEEDDDTSYDVSGNLDESNARADARDYAADDASSDVTDRFGIADEVRFWSAVGLSALAAGGAIIGVLQHMKANEAKKAYDDLETLSKDLNNKVNSACADDPNPAACKIAIEEKGAFIEGSDWSLAGLQSRMKSQGEVRDSYSTARNIWFAFTGVTLTAAIVLFVW